MNSTAAKALRLRKIIEECVHSVLLRGEVIPGEDEDWIESGAVDSMGYVELLLLIEEAVGVSGFLRKGEGALPCTTREAIEAALAANGSPSLN
jgi:acyl carrier protein